MKLYIEYWENEYQEQEKIIMYHVSWKICYSGYISWVSGENIYHWLLIITIWQNSGWTLIGITEKHDGKFSYHEYFCIHDDIFDNM